MEKIKVLIKRPDETFGHMTWISNTLKNLQNTVDGHIEVVPIKEGLVMICNEEGKIRELDRNFHMGVFPYGDLIRGTVIICGTKDEEFTDIPIDMKQWKLILSLWGN